ncbi:DUF3168 domain-containing protein [Kitasatospora sp. NPDC002965]|uniref:DUF3168 domain-containing protein n=1 Tax=Kitasatospora sp. NPDC002965 TaxID=3154775 RepID=UPI0033B8E122
MSATAPMGPVQAAVYAALTADEQLLALASGVYDYVPEGTAYPYVVIGEAIETPDNRLGGFGRQTVLTLHIWSQYRGHHQGQAVGARVMAVLDHQPLAIDGLDHVSTHYEMGQTLTDPEPPGDIRHLVHRYRIKTEQPTG